MAKIDIEPSATSYTWNVVRCACILAMLFVPADIVGLALYNVFYGADIAMFCMTVFCAIILALVGGFWFAYFDLKYAKIIERYDEELEAIATLLYESTKQ